MPIIPYLMGNGQVTFQPGNQQGGITLQSINAPTLTYQQYIEFIFGAVIGAFEFTICAICGFSAAITDKGLIP